MFDHPGTQKLGRTDLTLKRTKMETRFFSCFRSYQFADRLIGLLLVKPREYLGKNLKFGFCNLRNILISETHFINIKRHLLTWKSILQKSSFQSTDGDVIVQINILFSGLTLLPYSLTFVTFIILHFYYNNLLLFRLILILW